MTPHSPPDAADPVAAPNPLFDLLSLYSRLRRPFVPEQKLIGYFLGLARELRGATDASQPLAEPARPPAASGEREYAPPKLPAADAPDYEVIEAATGRAVSDVIFQTILPEVRDVAPTVRLFEATTEPPTAARPSSVDCRLFLLDPRVLPLLLGAAGTDRVREAFDPARVAGRPALARLLSAVPDLDGTLDRTGQLHMPTVRLPGACRNLARLPDGTTVVLAVDSHGGQA